MLQEAEMTDGLNNLLSANMFTDILEIAVAALQQTIHPPTSLFELTFLIIILN